MLAFILNFPYSLCGLIDALISVPTSIKFRKNPYAIIFHVKTLHWYRLISRRDTRAITTGHMIILGPKIENRDLEHELIHVDQYSKNPIIFPILYYIETIQKGYRKNRYEDEAYRLSGSIYHGIERRGVSEP